MSSSKSEWSSADTHRAFGGSPLAGRIGYRLAAAVRLSQLTDEEIQELTREVDVEGIIPERKWLKNTAKGWCEFIDADDMEACQRTFIKKAISGPIEGQLGAPLGDCDGCVSLRARLAAWLRNR